jgi:hypothetical protein
MSWGSVVVHPKPGPKPKYVPRVTTPPDVRHPLCRPKLEKIQQSKRRLPNTTVIFCFCNEPSKSLFHSIHSVIERSPPELLHEIVLVDDGSNAEHIGKSLEDYVSALPVTVKIVRQGKRTGLMRARVAGAKARGERERKREREKKGWRNKVARVRRKWIVKLQSTWLIFFP